MAYQFVTDLQRRWWFWSLITAGLYVPIKRLREAKLAVIRGEFTYEYAIAELRSEFWRIIRGFAPAAIYDLVKTAGEIISGEFAESQYGQYRVDTWAEAEQSLAESGFAIYTPRGSNQEFLYTQTWTPFGEGIVTKILFRSSGEKVNPVSPYVADPFDPHLP